MENGIVNELHKILTYRENAKAENNKPAYQSITLDYTPELFNDICDSYGDYYQIGYTVCGAQDPAVIYLGQEFIKNHPELKGFTVVRIIDKFLNEWNSATLLEFSHEDLTDEEYKLYDELMKEEENDN